MTIPDEMKKEIYERDNYRCHRCGSKKHPFELQIHHIQPASRDGSTKPENLITLCGNCHERLHRYNELMSDRPDRGLTSFTLPDRLYNEYIDRLGETLDDDSVCIPIHIREAVYGVISINGSGVAQAINFWRVDLRPEHDDDFGVCDCPSETICRHIVEVHLVDPEDITENGDWNQHAIDPGMGVCWAPLCVTDITSQVSRHPELQFESNMKQATPYILFGE